MVTDGREGMMLGWLLVGWLAGWKLTYAIAVNYGYGCSDLKYGCRRRMGGKSLGYSKHPGMIISKRGKYEIVFDMIR